MGSSGSAFKIRAGRKRGRLAAMGEEGSNKQPCQSVGKRAACGRFSHAACREGGAVSAPLRIRPWGLV